MQIVPNSFGARPAPLREVIDAHGRAHEPPGSRVGGRYARKTGTAAILQGVDSSENAARIIGEARRVRRFLTGPEGTEAEMARNERLAEQGLRALPFVHGTSVEGAVSAITGGLVSSKELREHHAAALLDDIADLQETIRVTLGKQWDKDLDLGEMLYEIQNEQSDEEDTSPLEDRFGVDRDAAKTALADLYRLSDIQQVLRGATAEPDRKLGLDEFVFMTHGALHQDYGPLGVVIDNIVFANDGWATPKDIVNYAPESDLHTYDQSGVDDYRRHIVSGDDYFRAAAAAIGSLKALPYRSRDQLWEIKVPRVPKEAVKGFVVHDDLDLAIRLRDRLAAHGLTNKVLYISEPGDAEHVRWYNRQMKHIQRTGSWNAGWAKQWNDVGGGGEIFVL